MSEKQSNKSIPSTKGGKRPGAGRPKGAVDKGNALIREMIVDALNDVGGVKYLADVAGSHPAAFLSLIGKVMPVQISGPDGGPIGISNVSDQQGERIAKEFLLKVKVDASK